MRIIKELCLSFLGLGGLALTFSPSAGLLLAATEETTTFDVALDCRRFNYNRGISPDQIVRGDGFIASGKIFRAGTLPSGNQTNDPNTSGSLGDLVARGTTTGSVAEHAADPTSPGLFVTLYVLLAEGMMVGEGWLSPAGVMQAAVVGGTRDFRGASGEMSQTIFGSNATGCPNLRLTVILKKQAPK